MGLFGRKGSTESEAINKFWKWFVKNGDRLFAGVQEGEPQIDDILQRLKKVSGGLSCQLSSQGETAQIEISADGVRERFPLVKQIVAGAPEVSRWQILAFRQPISDARSLSIQFQGQSLKIDDFKFVSRSDGQCAEIQVFAPGEGASPSQDVLGAMFVLLDALLGEYAVETKIRIASAQTLASAPENAQPLGDLLGVVRSMQD
ncbi:MAG TPA: hypothetical protein VNI20_09845 [Fimbriimonadaceae bacterium]|nr:hypothetical protein [Fimbriimonadaceae bacterium]